MRQLVIAVLAGALGSLAQAQSVTVPPGTTVPLKLGSPLSTRATRPGDPVHAETAFPVAAEGRVAIPSGTYVEGVVDKVNRHGPHAGFEIHFTRIIFANGYTVPLAASGTLTASLADPGLGDPAAAGMMESLQSCPLPPCIPQTPTLTPPPNPGPNKGLIIGASLAGSVALVVATVLLSRRGAGLYLDVGSPLKMVLSSPLSLDVSKLPAAVAAPGS